MQSIGRDGNQHHLDKIDSATAKPIGQKTERQTYQGTGKNGGCNQQTKLGFAQAQCALDLDSDNGKHGPHGKINRKCQRVHAEDRNLFLFVEFVFGGGCSHQYLPAFMNQDFYVVLYFE